MNKFQFFIRVKCVLYIFISFISTQGNAQDFMKRMHDLNANFLEIEKEADEYFTSKGVYNDTVTDKCILSQYGTFL